MSANNQSNCLMFSEKLNKFINRIPGVGIEARVNASHVLCAGTAIYIMAAGVPVDNNIGIEPMRVPTRNERMRGGGYENFTVRDFCLLYKDLNPAKRDYELEFYEECFC